MPLALCTFQCQKFIFLKYDDLAHEWLLVNGFVCFFFFTKVMDLNIVLKTIEESPLQKPLAII